MPSPSRPNTHSDGIATSHFNGKIERPGILKAEAALSAALGPPLPTPLSPDWDFSQAMWYRHHRRQRRFPTAPASIFPPAP